MQILKNLIIIPSALQAAGAYDVLAVAFHVFRPPPQHVWVVYLEGGMWCWDAPSCASRLKETPYLTSSKYANGQPRWPSQLYLAGTTLQLARFDLPSDTCEWRHAPDRLGDSPLRYPSCLTSRYAL